MAMVGADSGNLYRRTHSLKARSHMTIGMTTGLQTDRHV